MTTGDDIVKYARTWLGTKWRHQGRGDGSPAGIDCAGLLVVTANHFGLPHEDLTGYGRNPERAFVEQIEKFTDEGDLLGPIPGAIGIFNDKFMPCHTGIFAVADDGYVTVIHSECRPKRRCHEEGYSDSTPSLKDRLIGIRLFKGVNYVV